jgi:monofunctional biosynthetic peptidoglycan transglycosylase
VSKGKAASQSNKSKQPPKERKAEGKKGTKGKKGKRWRGIVLRVVMAGLLLSLIAGIIFWATLPDVSGLAKENPETTAFIELRKSEAKEAGKKFRLRWKWRPLKRISPYLRHAVVAAEDAKFWKHRGVDWDAMEQAVEQSWENKSLSGRGGSTITQQLAKNLYLSPSRNPIRKLREFFIARRLESELSKDRILEIYLNIAEWGTGVFGAEAAANKWYAVSARQLTPAQAARLAVALPNPFKRSAKRDTKWLNRKAARLLRSMRMAGLINQQGLEKAYGDLGLEWKGKKAKTTPLASPNSPQD